MSWSFSPSLPAAALEPYIEPGRGEVKYYDGTQWMLSPVKVYNADTKMWKRKPIKIYNGSSWVPTNFTGSLSFVANSSSNSSFTLDTPGACRVGDIFVGLYGGFDNDSEAYDGSYIPASTKLIANNVLDDGGDLYSHVVCYGVMTDLSNKTAGDPGGFDSYKNLGFYFRPNFRVKNVLVSSINYQALANNSAFSTQVISSNNATYPSISFGIFQSANTTNFNPNFNASPSFDNTISHTASFTGLMQLGFACKINNTPASQNTTSSTSGSTPKLLSSFYLEFVPE